MTIESSFYSKRQIGKAYTTLRTQGDALQYKTKNKQTKKPSRNAAD